MYDARLESVRITDSKLSFVNLRASKLARCPVRSLRHVDLRGLDLESISGVDSLRGAVVSSTQAVDLARIFADHLGLTVVDERSDT